MAPFDDPDVFITYYGYYRLRVGITGRGRDGRCAVFWHRQTDPGWRCHPAHLRRA